MVASESRIIERFFGQLGARRADVRLGVGDDAAVVAVPAGRELVLTTDALVEGVHFLPGANAHSLGHRALAVNLSDLAAMGATPAWALLSLVLPGIDEAWLEQFALGFGTLATAQGVALVGGNLSRGPLSITVQMAGVVRAGSALTRTGARPGDLLYVSGTLGDAAAAHAVRTGALQPQPADAAYLKHRFEYPAPRVALGCVLAGIASACVDISDGLYADLGRVLRACGCGARLDVAGLPLSPALRRSAGADAWRMGMAGGEDYELCFSLPPARAADLAQALKRGGAGEDVRVSHIGVLQPGAGIELMSGDAVMQFSHPGYDHFAG